jgi:hypothetical protein
MEGRADDYRVARSRHRPAERIAGSAGAAAALAAATTTAADVPEGADAVTRSQFRQIAFQRG